MNDYLQDGYVILGFYVFQQLRRKAIASSIAEYEGIKQDELDHMLADLRADEDNREIQHKVLQILDDLRS